MKVLAKWLVAWSLPVCAMLVGASDRTPARVLDGDTLFSTLMGAVCVALVFLWYWIDSRDRAYRRTWALCLAMALLPALALPWYMFRSRPGVTGAWSICKAIGMFILSGLLYRLSSTIGTAH